LDALGPEAPTLLAPWTTRDLAAHLVLRERDPVAAPGLVVPGAWSRLAERHRTALVAHDYGDLVATIRSGPTGFFRIPWVRRVANLNELFVHHEDVRRANGLTARTNDGALDDALWRNVTMAPWLLTRRLRGVGLELERTTTGEVRRARRGNPAARIRGAPGEILLYLFGRKAVVDVEISGPAAAVESVRHASFGI
jgi:uncharacterized protein (TIGR03085 family)